MKYCLKFVRALCFIMWLLSGVAILGHVSLSVFGYIHYGGFKELVVHYAPTLPMGFNAEEAPSLLRWYFTMNPYLLYFLMTALYVTLQISSIIGLRILGKKLKKGE